jgi:hypothetical protein
MMSRWGWGGHVDVMMAIERGREGGAERGRGWSAGGECECRNLVMRSGGADEWGKGNELMAT